MFQTSGKIRELGCVNHAISRNQIHNFSSIPVQGGPSGCRLNFVDFKTKFPSQYSFLILKCNSQCQQNVVDSLVGPPCTADFIDFLRSVIVAVKPPWREARGSRRRRAWCATCAGSTCSWRVGSRSPVREEETVDTYRQPLDKNC